MISGSKIFSRLIGKIDSQESVSSSHWNHYHKDFNLNSLKGVQGFGHLNKNYGLISDWMHRLFQAKYRKMSSKSTEFTKINAVAKRITCLQGRANNLDVLRQTLTLDFLIQKIDFEKINRTVIIGDGFGTMTSLILENKLSEQIFLVNLRKTLLVDLLYIEKAIGAKRFQEEVVLIQDIKHLSEINPKHKVIGIEAENYHFLGDIKKDLVLNIASFQEMDFHVINNYFKYIYKQEDKSFYFYLCNREEKFLPDGSLIEFKNYPFKENDLTLVDELCPWHQYFYTFKPPFEKFFDGPIRHQLRKVNN